jgi:hypothetical protein
VEKALARLKISRKKNAGIPWAMWEISPSVCKTHQADSTQKSCLCRWMRHRPVFVPRICPCAAWTGSYGTD